MSIARCVALPSMAVRICSVMDMSISFFSIFRPRSAMVTLPASSSERTSRSTPSASTSASEKARSLARGSSLTSGMSWSLRAATMFAKPGMFTTRLLRAANSTTRSLVLMRVWRLRYSASMIAGRRSSRASFIAMISVRPSSPVFASSKAVSSRVLGCRSTRSSTVRLPALRRAKSSSTALGSSGEAKAPLSTGSGSEARVFAAASRAAGSGSHARP